MTALIVINVFVACAVAFCLVTPKAARMVACWWWSWAHAVEVGREGYAKMWEKSSRVEVWP